MRLGACSTAAPRTLAGPAGGSTPTALRRDGGLVRGRVHDVRARGFPKEAPVRDSTKVKKRRGQEMGAPSSPGRNSERDPGTPPEKLPSRGQPGRSRTERGRKPAPGLQRWRIRAASDSAVAPCGTAAGRALASLPPRLDSRTTGRPEGRLARHATTLPEGGVCAFRWRTRVTQRAEPSRPRGVGGRPEGCLPCAAHVPECACGG